MSRVSRILIRLIGAVFVLALITLAFKPFELVTDCFRRPGPPLWNETEQSVRIEPGRALEDRRNPDRVRRALTASGQISVELDLQTGSVDQSGPARIFSFSRDSMSRNFTVAQEGNGFVFRLRTSFTDLNGIYPSLVVPEVFDSSHRQHLVVTYDGIKVRLYVDGILSEDAIDLNGSFENWSRNQTLILGDEPAGNYPWLGELFRVAVYDRALSPQAVTRLSERDAAQVRPAVILEYNFDETPADQRPLSLVPLRYRNLVVISDTSIFNWTDCIANVIGFIPVAPLVYFALPRSKRGRNVRSVFVIPVALGGAISLFFELSQRYLAGRVPSTLDLGYNTLGSLIGAVLLWIFLTAQKRNV